MSPIDYDVTLMFYFDILGRRKHCIWTRWFVWYTGHKPIAYDLYIYMYACVGRGPWSTWLMRCFLLSEELWNTWKYNLEVLGISPRAYHVVQNKIWNIGSLAIVFLGVSYKYILALELSEELWNCTMFVTTCF